MLTLVLPLLCHVPTYGVSVENCFTPPHHHDISQVIYIKGSGGLEIHCTAAGGCPFDLDGDEVLDVDAVFRDEIDQSTYSLYIGCGGCVASADPIVIPPVHLTGYEPAVIEPFTQTRYSSVFPKEQRKYNSSGLRYDVCDQGHFTIRLVDHMNRTDAVPIVWGAVIGLAESFTFEELFLFPDFVLRNHGETWNEQGWTIWVTVFVFAPGFLVVLRLMLRACGFKMPRSSPFTMKFKEGETKPTIYWRRENPREMLYELAVIAFVTTMIEEFIHLNIAAQGTSLSDYGYWVGLFAVILFANGLPLYQVLTSWMAIDYRRTEAKDISWWERSKHNYWSCSRSPLWAPFEILFGFSYLFLFGAGFWVGPILIMLAGTLRLFELRRRGSGRPGFESKLYKVNYVEVPPGEETATLLFDEMSQRPAMFMSA